MPDPEDYSINAHSISLWTLSYLAIQKRQVVATAQVCSEESASTTFFWTVGKVAPLYGTPPALGQHSD